MGTAKVVRVAIVSSPSYADVYGAVKRGIELIGGVGDIISRGKRVLLKPNLLSAKPPDNASCCCVSTH